MNSPKKTPILFVVSSLAVAGLVALAACSGSSASVGAGQGNDSGSADGGGTGPSDGALDSTSVTMDSSVVHPDSSAKDSTTQDSGPSMDAGGDVVVTACLGDGGVDCSQNAQVCDPASNMCVDCLTNSDCDPTFAPFCDLQAKTCVQCLKVADCPFDSPGCFQGFCGECGTVADCPAHNTCEGADIDAGIGGQCACQDSTGCGGDAPTCVISDAGASNSCGCTADPQCPNGQRCGTSLGVSGICFDPCTGDAGACDPASFQPVCLDSTGMCVECITDGQCASASPSTPYCDPTNNCAGCLVDNNCTALDAGTPYCVQEFCGACRTYADCPANMPGCDSIFVICGSCSLDSDCPPGDVCLGPNGSTCVPEPGDAGAPD